MAGKEQQEETLSPQERLFEKGYELTVRIRQLVGSSDELGMVDYSGKHSVSTFELNDSVYQIIIGQGFTSLNRVSLKAEDNGLTRDEEQVVVACDKIKRKSNLIYIKHTGFEATDFEAALDNPAYDQIDGMLMVIEDRIESYWNLSVHKDHE